MLTQVKEQAIEKMIKAIETLQKDLATLRTGRATPKMLDKVFVNCYGQDTPLNQVSNISTSDARSLVITPWDKSLLADVEQAVLKSDLGFTPNNDGNAIRINVPMLTEERRKELVKMSKKLGEESKISIRNIRRDANNEVKKAEKNGEVPEDMSRRIQDELQKLTDKYISEAESVLANKEKEILEV